MKDEAFNTGKRSNNTGKRVAETQQLKYTGNDELKDEQV